MDGMPRLGDDVGPGCDLRFWTRSCYGCTWKPHAAAAAPSRSPLTTWTRSKQAVPVSEIVFVRWHLAPLTGPDPGGGLDEKPLGHSTALRRYSSCPIAQKTISGTSRRSRISTPRGQLSPARLSSNAFDSQVFPP